jgi:beta-lactam-binding protein with PASTA domain
MDDPQYIVLVALDTPARSTGIYISGGVMAAPTVGAVMADILPYLGVKHNYTEEDAAGRTVVLDDYTGMSAAEAKKQLAQLGIGCLLQGTQDTVTAQLPAAGTAVPGDSQIILYFGDDPRETLVEVPDFTGMTRQQANDAAGSLSLYVLVKGNTDISPNVTVAYQSVAPKTKIKVGSTVELTFTDTKVKE